MTETLLSGDRLASAFEACAWHASAFEKLGVQGETLYSIVRDHGQIYEPPESNVDDPGEPGTCFPTSGHWALEDPAVRYVEGWAFPDWSHLRDTPGPGPLLVHHAWVVEVGTGQTWDPTWNTPGWSYVGVEFTWELLTEAVERAQQWPVLAAWYDLRGWRS